MLEPFVLVASTALDPAARVKAMKRIPECIAGTTLGGASRALFNGLENNLPDAGATDFNNFQGTPLGLWMDIGWPLALPGQLQAFGRAILLCPVRPLDNLGRDFVLGSEDRDNVPWMGDWAQALPQGWKKIKSLLAVPLSRHAEFLREMRAQCPRFGGVQLGYAKLVPKNPTTGGGGQRQPEAAPRPLGALLGSPSSSSSSSPSTAFDPDGDCDHQAERRPPLLPLAASLPAPLPLPSCLSAVFEEEEEENFGHDFQIQIKNSFIQVVCDDASTSSLPRSSSLPDLSKPLVQDDEESFGHDFQIQIKNTFIQVVCDDASTSSLPRSSSLPDLSKPLVRDNKDLGRPQR